MIRQPTRLAVLFSFLIFGAALPGSPALAKTLLVGPNQQLKTPSAAARVASNGDTIKIEPLKGGYYDCAVWRASNLTIEGEGPGVVLTDTTCQGKAIFVTVGDNITIRNITFQRARVPDNNGAGIRAEGANLTIDNSRFIDNQDGILTTNSPKSTIIIRNSKFLRNGICLRYCAHALYTGVIAELRVEHSVFRDTHQGHDIKSRAFRTVLIGNTIVDGPNGTSSYLVDVPNGGSLIMRNNILEKGPRATNHTCAITIGEEGVNRPTPEIVIASNKFTNDMSVATIFVRNITATPAKLTANTFVGKVVPLSGDGSVH